MVDDMMHDGMMMHKTKEQANLIGVIPEAVTIDTTNKEPRVFLYHVENHH
jgi:hypothetical protein